MLLVSVVTSAIAGANIAMATTSRSPNYQTSETKFGSGASLDSCSGQYCSDVTIGELGDGQSSSTNYSASFGPIADGEPLLEVIVEPGESNLGVLTTESTATKTTIIKVRSYMSDGYIMQIVGDPPKYDDHSLKALSVPTAATPGVEQFGINLTANTEPAVGKEPVQVPSGLFGFGKVSEDYGIANMFKYVSGDVVARSEVESGQTEYTLSIIVNISNSTPAGHYAGDYSALVVPAF